VSARFTNVDAVTFDFYNTLVYHRTGRGRGAMLMEYLRGQGLGSDPWEHQVLYDIFERHEVEYAPSYSASEKQRYYRRLAVRVFRRLNVRVHETAAMRHAEEVWKLLGPASLGVFPEVRDVLCLVRECGLRTAVVSNWQCGLEHFCAELGLRDVFDHVLASADVGVAKPDPAIFLEACNRLNVPPHRVLHVGDSPVDDVAGGHDAGLQVILVQREEGVARVDAQIIGSLLQLPDMLGLG
jgi:putative hydrolase of the HAD superfamily